MQHITGRRRRSKPPARSSTQRPAPNGTKWHNTEVPDSNTHLVLCRESWWTLSKIQRSVNLLMFTYAGICIYRYRCYPDANPPAETLRLIPSLHAVEPVAQSWTSHVCGGFLDESTKVKWCEKTTRLYFLIVGSRIDVICLTHFFRGVSNACHMSYCTHHEQIIHYSQVKELDDVDYRCTNIYIFFAIATIECEWMAIITTLKSRRSYRSTALHPGIPLKLVHLTTQMSSITALMLLFS